jgi:hypothetical protein
MRASLHRRALRRTSLIAASLCLSVLGLASAAAALS